MHTSNHSFHHRRLYWLTDPGKRLAAYLTYTAWQPLTEDIQFADVPAAEAQNDDRPESELDRLYEQLDEELDNLHNWQHASDDEFLEARSRVKDLRLKIYNIENGGHHDQAD